MASVPAPELYLLVHPERWPSNDANVIASEDWVDDLLPGFDAAYGRQVLAQTQAAHRSVCVLDHMDAEWLLDEAFAAEMLDEENSPGTLAEVLVRAAHTPDGDDLQAVVGVPLRHFGVLTADPGELDEAMQRIGPPARLGDRVLIGGFNRYDCVQRCEWALASLGWQVDICPTTALPLLDPGVAAYLTEASTGVAAVS